MTGLPLMIARNNGSVCARVYAYARVYVCVCVCETKPVLIGLTQFRVCVGDSACTCMFVGVDVVYVCGG